MNGAADDRRQRRRDPAAGSPDGESGSWSIAAWEAACAGFLEILRDPALGKALGRKGKEHTRAHFLTPRLLRDWLDLFTDLKV